MTDFQRPVDAEALGQALRQRPTAGPPPAFAPNDHIRRLDASVDVDRLRTEAEQLLRPEHDQGNGFATLLLTCRPTSSDVTSEDLSGRYWTATEDGEEIAHEPLVDESAFTEVIPELVGTYLAEVIALMRSVAPIGRVRLLGKEPYNCNSWHRDPEPRLHLPIIADPGSLFIVDNHATHLPADGSIYFTDTRRYHTALNGGSARRLSLVAAIAT